MKRIISIIIFLLLCGATIWAAPPVITSSIEPSEGLIGDRFTLSVKVEKDVMQMVDFPKFENGKASQYIELLGDSPVDTLAVTGRRMILEKRYFITSFNAGTFSMGGVPVLYVDKNITDTLKTTDTLSIVVKSFEIDTAKQTIYDIKPTEKTPLVFGEFQGYLFGVILLGLIIAAVIIVTSRYIARRRGRVVVAEKPKEPAHVTAIRALETLQGQKLWQAGKVKAYYTILTDILRRYLGGRYGIDAMESTTDEILEQMGELSRENYDTLRRILQLSDIVKFAKGVPTEEENEQVWYDSYRFVEETKYLEQEQETENSKQEML